MSYVTKFFVLGLSSVAMLLATESQAEAGRRHRHRHQGHQSSHCAPAPTTCCNDAYAAPVSNGCCTTNSYGTEVQGTHAYGSGHASPQMAPVGSSSPSDMPAAMPPAPGVAVPPEPAAR